MAGSLDVNQKVAKISEFFSGHPTRFVPSIPSNISQIAFPYIFVYKFDTKYSQIPLVQILFRTRDRIYDQLTNNSFAVEVTQEFVYVGCGEGDYVSGKVYDIDLLK